ncbi:TPA: hypothetical protein ACXNW8_000120 [Clostridium botulinum]|uniref:hypothetical protein n=1 Tax=Clostridium botulinum TaxID=1491 RepID=UPI0009579729|nr:hypothetical protein [Clostridium botulinum]APU61251.1 hypothetical protein NPD8_3210 [Clostridium botulinum]BDB02190.1 hypothetical protein CBOS2020_22640 [Clostridium botulinum]
MQYGEKNIIEDLELKEIEKKLNDKLEENKIDLDKYDINKIVQMIKEKGIFK